MKKCTIQWQLFMAGCLLSSSLQAKLVEWKDQLPSALAPFQNSAPQLAELTADRILIFAHPAATFSLPTLKNGANTTARFYTAAVVIPTNSQNVAKLLTSYSGYVGLFPTLKSVKLLEQQGSTAQVRYQVHIPTPIPVLNFKENVVMQHQISGNSISSLVIDGPIPYGAGKFEWFDLGNNRTLVTLTHWGDLTQPKGFVFSRILKALPEAKLGIPAGTGAFVMESLQRRYKPVTAHALKAGELPDPHLNNAQLQKVLSLSQLSQEPVSFILGTSQLPYQHGMENMRFTSSYQYYAKAQSALQPWLQPTAYKALFPRQLKEIKTTAVPPSGQNAEFKVSVGLGVISIPFNFRMRFQYPGNAQNDYFANGGDLKFLRGGMRLLPQKNGTLLYMVNAVKIDDKAPFLLRAMRSLPYHDMLPAVGGNTVFVLKLKQQLK